jgi:hypothetical protein
VPRSVRVAQGRARSPATGLASPDVMSKSRSRRFPRPSPLSRSRAARSATAPSCTGRESQRDPARAMPPGPSRSVRTPIRVARRTPPRRPQTLPWVLPARDELAAGPDRRKPAVTERCRSILMAQTKIRRSGRHQAAAARAMAAARTRHAVRQRLLTHRDADSEISLAQREAARITGGSITQNITGGPAAGSPMPANGAAPAEA